ncbi:cytochrome C assembly family protein [Castellaniella sp. S9]|uniref:cytochrome C assembly family protein n=1 Tax=Castellaniella sp. S9 TaxID=2993652 RepID=UPI0022B5A0BB|nr:cytochrome c biogenesis protein CcsA [Castellaniella sp. S9]
MSASIVFHLLAALAYGVLTAARWRPLARGQAGQPSKAIGRLCVLGAIGLHGAGIALAIIVPQGLHLGWALALSTAVWLGMIVFWIENFLLRIDSVLLLLLPAAAVTCLLAAAFPQGHLVPHANNDWLRTHLLIAMTAYGLITVAALHAMLMTALDRQLHRPVQAEDRRDVFARALESMPPLLVLEQLLFRLIWIGFAVLTLTVVTGIQVSLRLGGPALPMDHKTVFTLLSWATFGVLLAGRHIKGWRGRTALRWTLAGFAFLLLSYTGSRFVLDVILQRGTLG